MEATARLILQPMFDVFGGIELTAGFHSPKVLRALAHPTVPSLDQHCAYEKNSRGNQICARGGFAVDLIQPNHSSQDIARFIVAELPFDRLYYYGDSRSVHVSHGPENNRAITLLVEQNGRLIPRNISKEKFLSDE